MDGAPYSRSAATTWTVGKASGRVIFERSTRRSGTGQSRLQRRLEAMSHVDMSALSGAPLWPAGSSSFDVTQIRLREP